LIHQPFNDFNTGNQLKATPPGSAALDSGQQVPQSQCSLRENPKFLQNFRSKNNTLKKNIDQYLCLISVIVIQAWHSKVKLFHSCIKLYVFHKENSQNLRQTQMSFVNEAPGPLQMYCASVQRSFLGKCPHV
jgi:hypothetical protein